LASPVETKGIIGSDRRHYVLDLTRMFPRDANFPDYKTHATALLRPELISHYCCRKALQSMIAEQNEKAKKKQAEIQKEKETDASGGGQAGDTEAEGTKPTQNGAENPKVVQQNGMEKNVEEESKVEGAKLEDSLEKGANKMAKEIAAVKFNPDVFCDLKMSDEKQQKRDENEVKAASIFLLTQVIPKLVGKSFRNLQESPLDGEHLVRIMHKNGINVRYLGQIAAIAMKLEMTYIVHLCTSEMIVRAAKHVLNEMLRGVKPELGEKQDTWFLAPCIARFLNSFLGANCCGLGLSEDELKAAKEVLKQIDEENANQGTQKIISRNKSRGKGKTKAKKDYVKFANGRRAPTDPLHPANLWVRIQSLVQQKFTCKLPSFEKGLPARRKLCMLRSLCKKVGIQLVSRNYKLDTKQAKAHPNIFTVDDILDLFPVVKTVELTSKDAADLMEQGKRCMAHGHPGMLQAAYLKLSDAQNILHQTYGPMHPQTAECYSLMALVCYKARDVLQAVEMQQKALLVYERTLGLDHSETAYAHSTMALFLHSIEHSKDAIKHLKRALFLLELMCGPNHPDVASTHFNLAMLYQDSKKVVLGLKHLRQARAVLTNVLGDKHFRVGLCDHAIAVAHSLMGNFREAVTCEMSAKLIYTAVLGEKNLQTQESKKALAWFAKQAVEVEKGLSKKGGLIPIHPHLTSFTWLSLRRVSMPTRGISPADLDSFIKIPRTMPKAPAQGQVAAKQAQVQSPAVDENAAASNAPVSKAQKRKLKRKLQKQRQKAEKEAAAREAALKSREESENPSQ